VKQARDTPADAGNGHIPVAPAARLAPHVEPRVYRQLFDRETLAECLRLSTDTIDRLVKANKLRCVRIGHQVRFTCEDVDAFLARHRTGSSEAP
jgi:excisionase family DNA binding protein